MSPFSKLINIASIQLLQKNLNGNAYIANELETRLLEHLPQSGVSTKQLDMLRDCSAETLVSETLPYQDATFDCVVAHFTLLWHKDIAAFFKEVRRILMPNGVFLFSTLGIKSAHEMERLGDLLLQASFHQLVIDRESLQLQYDNDSQLFADLASSSLNDQLVQVVTEPSGQITATLEVIYGYALGKVISPAFPGKIEIPVENITLRKFK
ncbi:MAG: methyltransferase domain-containing protein [Gammaproteobacteria bacterium]|nr:methyltransferase domain-containing protein [Gammaproteobacteria bacterium]